MSVAGASNLLDRSIIGARVRLVDTPQWLGTVIAAHAEFEGAYTVRLDIGVTHIVLASNLALARGEKVTR